MFVFGSKKLKAQPTRVRINGQQRQNTNPIFMPSKQILFRSPKTAKIWAMRVLYIKHACPKLYNNIIIKYQKSQQVIKAKERYILPCTANFLLYGKHVKNLKVRCPKTFFVTLYKCIKGNLGRAVNGKLNLLSLTVQTRNIGIYCALFIKLTLFFNINKSLQLLCKLKLPRFQKINSLCSFDCQVMSNRLFCY